MDQGLPHYHDKNNGFGILGDSSIPDKEDDTTIDKDDDTVSYGEKPSKKTKFVMTKAATSNDTDFETVYQASLKK